MLFERPSQFVSLSSQICTRQVSTLRAQISTWVRMVIGRSPLMRRVTLQRPTCCTSFSRRQRKIRRAAGLHSIPWCSVTWLRHHKLRIWNILGEALSSYVVLLFVTSRGCWVSHCVCFKFMDTITVAAHYVCELSLVWESIFCVLGNGCCSRLPKSKHQG